MAEVSAPDHMPNQIALPREVADALAAVKPFRPYSGPPLVTVDLFAGPRPTVELVLPVGFRGLVKTEVHVQPNGAWPAGQRVFSYPVPVDGVIRLDGPAVFGVEGGPKIVAKFADGTPLPGDGNGPGLALRWLKREGAQTVFVIGTSSEADAIRCEMGIGHGSAQSSGGGSGDRPQGGGRRGGGGGIGGGRGGRGGMGR